LREREVLPELMVKERREKKVLEQLHSRRGAVVAREKLSRR